MLGQYLNLTLAKEFEILILYHTHAGNAIRFNSVKGDLCDFRFLQSTLRAFHPDVVLHNAAISNAEVADRVGKKKTFCVNVGATRIIAEICEELEANLIFNSTDLVYADSNGELLDEEAPLNPLSYYAESKLLAEEAIQKSTANYLILRNALMYGFGLNHSRNHFHGMFEKLKAGEKVPLFIDQFRTPLELSNAAELIRELIRKGITCEILNFGGPVRLSRFQLGEKVCEVFSFDKSLLVSSSLEKSNLKYKVRDVSMNISKLRSLGLAPKKSEVALEDLRERVAI